MPSNAESPLAVYLLSAGWLLGLLGFWGAIGTWWVWPLGLGAALLVAGSVIFLAQVRLARSAPKDPVA